MSNKFSKFSLAIFTHFVTFKLTESRLHEDEEHLRGCSESCILKFFLHISTYTYIIYKQYLHA